ncbi:MAG TPA: hypothetical protein VHS96_16505 [Bacteroidia bacterium]|nr:hypothetical protein [Bacteroidia bacterium]
MSKLYTIPKGGHSAEGLRTSLVVGNSMLRFKAKFYPNCIYKPQREPEQISKLYGISYGLHHDCSARIGWRSDGTRIEVLSYVYTARDKRSSEHLAFIDVQEWHEFKLERIGKTARISMDGGPVQTFQLLAPAKVGYRLFPYFGGTVPAPHEMWIGVEVLELDGIGA